MMSFIRRQAACLAMLLAAVGFVAPVALAQQAADTAPAAQAAPAPAVTKEVIENPYGLEAMWRQGDWVSKGTLIILVIMSMGSWYIIFVKLWEQAKLSVTTAELVSFVSGLHADRALEFGGEEGLNLDNLGPIIRQQPGGIRACQHPGEVQHANVFEDGISGHAVPSPSPRNGPRCRGQAPRP